MEVIDKAKQFIVVKPIPKEDLKDYSDYIGFLFKNQDDVYNICDTEEDIIKSNQWFNNIPQHAIVVEESNDIQVGDRFMSICVNRDLNGKTFTYNGTHQEGEGLVNLTDKDGKEVITTTFILVETYKVLRKAKRKDLDKLINGIITPITNY